MYPTSPCGATEIVATRAVLSAIVIGREAPTLNGQIGSTGNGIIIGGDGMITTGADRSEAIKDENSPMVEPIVQATADTGKVIAPKVIFGEGQIRRFSIIA